MCRRATVVLKIYCNYTGCVQLQLANQLCRLYRPLMAPFVSQQLCQAFGALLVSRFHLTVAERHD